MHRLAPVRGSRAKAPRGPLQLSRTAAGLAFVHRRFAAGVSEGPAAATPRWTLQLSSGVMRIPRPAQRSRRWQPVATRRIPDETHLPSFQDSPRTHARFSRSHEDARRTRRHQRTPRQGPQAPGRLTRLRRRSLQRPCRVASCDRKTSSACWRNLRARAACISRSTSRPERRAGRPAASARQALRSSRQQTSYPQGLNKLVTGLWMTCLRLAARRVSHRASGWAPSFPGATRAAR